MTKVAYVLACFVAGYLATNVASASNENSKVKSAVEALGIQAMKIEIGIVPVVYPGGRTVRKLSVIMTGASRLPLILEKRPIKIVELEQFRVLCRDAVNSYIPGIQHSALYDDPENFYIQLVATRNGIFRNTSVNLVYEFSLKNGCSEKRVSLAEK